MKTKKTTCAAKGCRRKSLEGNSLCEGCKRKSNDPFEGVMALESEELERFLRLDAEIRNYIQEDRILELEQREADFEYDRNKRHRHQRRMQAENRKKQKSVEQQSLLRAVAKRFDLDVKSIAVDDKTGVIRTIEFEDT